MDAPYCVGKKTLLVLCNSKSQQSSNYVVNMIPQEMELEIGYHIPYMRNYHDEYQFQVVLVESSKSLNVNLCHDLVKYSVDEQSHQR